MFASGVPTTLRAARPALLQLSARPAARTFSQAPKRMLQPTPKLLRQPGEEQSGTFSHLPSPTLLHPR